jgi:hypothetical protein
MGSFGALLIPVDDSYVPSLFNYQRDFGTQTEYSGEKNPGPHAGSRAIAG